MLTYQVTSVSLDSLREKSQGKKVVLLYPWKNYRNIFLSYFLDNAREGLLYYRVSGHHASLESWLEQLVNHLGPALDGFGNHLENALKSDSSPEELAQALATDLDEYRKERSVLYLDELDQVPHNKEFREFIDSLVDTMPEQAQLAVNSRLLTYQPWITLIEDGDAIVLSSNIEKNDLMFEIQDKPKPQVEVYAFGPGNVLTNGDEIESWDGALPRNLFFYFVDNPLITRDQIFETFWPNLGVKEATNVFHVTKRKITERISDRVSDGETYELTKYSAGYYMPSSKIVRHYDVEVFEDSLERALMSDDDVEREELYTQAIDLYKAPFLQTVDMPWVEERRAKLQGLYADALVGMARILVKQERYEKAIGYFIRASRELPDREDIHRQIMRLYAKIDQVDDALYQYEKLETYLKDSSGAKPSRETKALRDEIATMI